MRTVKEGTHNCPMKYKGVRRRKWGKWVSEIRIPGSRNRLWLGSYTTPEAAAVAHDTAVFCLRGPSSATRLNFPMCVPTFLQPDMSPRSIQEAASNTGMAVDARLIARLAENDVKLGIAESSPCRNGDYEENIHREDELGEEASSISIYDMEIYM